MVRLAALSLRIVMTKTGRKNSAGKAGVERIHFGTGPGSGI